MSSDNAVRSNPMTADRLAALLLEHAIKPFATAGAFVLVAFLWTLLLQQILAYPLVFLFFGAVMGAAWFGGRMAGLFAVVQAAILVAYFFVPPVFSFTIDKNSKSYFVAYIVASSAATLVTLMKRHTEEAIRHARDTLELRVAERTSELERSYRELQRSEHELRELTEAIPQQIWSAAPDGSFEYCNQHLLQLVGASESQLRGQEFLRIFHPEDREIFASAWRAALASGQRLEGEWRIQCVGCGYRWFLVRALPRRGQDGAILRWYGTLIDVDDREKAQQQLARTQSEFARLSRVLSMGEMAVSIAHEINQPLTAVVTQGYACLGWLKAQPPNLEKARRTTEKIVEEGTRAGAVVQRIRALFSRESRPRVRVEINSVIREMVGLLREAALRYDVSVRTRLANGLPPVEIDRVQIQQVLVNLAVNGMEAMSGTPGARELMITSSLGEDGAIRVRVEDSGPGITPEDAERIFDPFFSTKEGGIGVGLSISRSIVEAHDGRLWTEPRRGGGTVFQFTLPTQSHEQ
jgi:PAS domain S-box-containing protein